MHFFSSSWESRARTRLHAVAAAAAGAAMLAACGGGSDHRGAVPVLFPVPPAAQPASPPPAPAVTAQKACGELNGKTVAGAALTAAMQDAAAGAPVYCKVTGTIAPALNFQISLPEAWNGKLYYQGGGGYNGAITPPSVPALGLGYAVVASDSGHQGNVLSADFALTDTFAAQLFGSLSVPTVMSTATETLAAAYGALPAKSYFEGCSNGGREALMAVQRAPNLFDGVIARAPAYNWVGFMGAFNRNSRALAAPGGAFSAAKTALLSKHVRDACDGLDGLVDGVVSNQAACTPALANVAALRCAGGTDTGDTCLSDAQLDVVTSWTTQASFTGSPAFRNAGWNLTGNEDDPGAWRTWLTGDGSVTSALQFLFQDTTVKNYLARDRTVDSLAYTPWDQNQNALYAMAALNDATNADIRPFINSGGKLILWHGGNDSALSVRSTTEYYGNMRNAIGAATADASTRFYVAPGVNHCAGGPGADTSDLLTALDQWVTKSAAPATLLAEKRDAQGAVLLSRPLCQYPQYPRYTGPANDAAAAKLAANYSCSS
ncbi:tannase/feruloyl esterase family alpha/beta hydrolase [Variovorax paradoxus]|uniref:tannase/feruloyl esterase family alpha/beta hydrolase n=1 Tax=Variovorax paradoxus TaxID=34073 RepID=UPI0003698362|nr:tannase/feruloyl esterase family alpha/beta hydrolase [Variovorax paradoxus]